MAIALEVEAGEGTFRQLVAANLADRVLQAHEYRAGDNAVADVELGEPRHGRHRGDVKVRQAVAAAIEEGVVGDVSRCDDEQLPRRPPEQVAVAEVPVLRDDHAAVGVCELRDLAVG